MVKFSKLVDYENQKLFAEAHCNLVLERTKAIARKIDFPGFLNRNNVDVFIYIHTDFLKFDTDEPPNLTGSNGYCRLARLPNDDSHGVRGEYACIKFLNDYHEPDDIIDEIAYIRLIWYFDHPNFVRPCSTEVDGENTFVVVYEKYDGMYRFGLAMAKIVECNVPVSDWSAAERLLAFAQVVDALNLLHSYGLSHCDLTDQNLLFDENKTPIIIDFGSMKRRQTREEQNLDMFDLRDLFFRLQLDRIEGIEFLTFLTKFVRDEKFLRMKTNQFCRMLGEISIGPICCAFQRLDQKFLVYEFQTREMSRSLYDFATQRIKQSEYIWRLANGSVTMSVDLARLELAMAYEGIPSDVHNEVLAYIGNEAELVPLN